MPIVAELPRDSGSVTLFGDEHAIGPRESTLVESVREANKTVD
jgi:hypothetical protein